MYSICLFVITRRQIHHQNHPFRKISLFPCLWWPNCNHSSKMGQTLFEFEAALVGLSSTSSRKNHNCKKGKYESRFSYCIIELDYWPKDFTYAVWWELLTWSIHPPKNSILHVSSFPAWHCTSTYRVGFGLKGKCFLGCRICFFAAIPEMTTDQNCKQLFLKTYNVLCVVFLASLSVFMMK